MEEEKLKLPKFYRIYLVLLIIAAIVLIIPTTRQKLFETFNLFQKTDMELRLVEEFPIDKSTSGINIYGDNTVEWSDNKLSIVDLNGVEVFKEDYKFEEADIVFGEEVFYIMDKSSGELLILNEEGKLKKELALGGSFEKLKEEGENIYVYKKDGDAETVNIINRDGELLKIHEERIPILTIDMDNKDSEYIVSLLHVDGDIRSIVDIYSLDDEKIMSIELKDEVVVYAKYIKDNAVVVTDTAVYLFKDGKEKWNKEIKNLKDVEVIGKNIYILYDDKFETLNLRGKIKEEIELDLPLEGIKATDKGILLFGKQNIIIPSSEKPLLNFKTNEDIIDLKYDNENLLIEMKNKVGIYKLIEEGEDIDE